jgi:hypothetical protein
MKTASQIRSLKTVDVASGMALSMDLAQDLSTRLAAARLITAKPGGTNYGEPAPVPVEMIASILMVAVSIANEGWKSTGT